MQLIHKRIDSTDPANSTVLFITYNNGTKKPAERKPDYYFVVSYTFAEEIAKMWGYDNIDEAMEEQDMDATDEIYSHAVSIVGAILEEGEWTEDTEGGDVF